MRLSHAGLREGRKVLWTGMQRCFARGGAAFVVVALWTASAAADTVVLRSGRVLANVETTIVGAQLIVVFDDGRKMRFALKQVRSIAPKKVLRRGGGSRAHTSKQPRLPTRNIVAPRRPATSTAVAVTRWQKPLRSRWYWLHGLNPAWSGTFSRSVWLGAGLLAMKLAALERAWSYRRPGRDFASTPEGYIATLASTASAPPHFRPLVVSWQMNRQLDPRTGHVEPKELLMKKKRQATRALAAVLVLDTAIAVGMQILSPSSALARMGKHDQQIEVSISARF